MLSIHLSLLSVFTLLGCAQQVSRDPVVYGPALELVHLYSDELLTGQSLVEALLRIRTALGLQSFVIISIH